MFGKGKTNQSGRDLRTSSQLYKLPDWQRNLAAKAQCSILVTWKNLKRRHCYKISFSSLVFPIESSLRLVVWPIGRLFGKQNFIKMVVFVWHSLFIRYIYHFGRFSISCYCCLKPKVCWDFVIFLGDLVIFPPKWVEKMKHEFVSCPLKWVC